MKPRIVFMGSPEFSLPSFASTYAFAEKHGGKVMAVFTQPDRPSGRGRKLAPVAIAEKAKELKLPLYQPRSLRKKPQGEEAIKILQDLAPDLIVVVAYGLILPASVLRIPEKGCVNVHTSLLPAYRGAAPVQWALARGETETGVTTMLMDEGLDTGPILLQKNTSIGENEYADEVQERLSRIGADLLTETLEGLITDSLSPRPQPQEGVSLAPILKKSDGIIDWNRSAQEILNRLRGFYPWPGAQTTWRGETLKIWRAKISPAAETDLPGTIIGVSGGQIVVAAGNRSALALTEVQKAGGKRQPVAEFLRGHSVRKGDLLGSAKT